MKQKTKRILAFAMAVVFALSTCVTSSPYTVMATEAGETITPLAEEGSGSEVATQVQKQEHLGKAVKEAR